MSRVFVGLLLFVSLNHVFSQSICIDSVLIDGSLTRIMKYKDLLKTGIKIDSITSAKPMDSYDPDSLIYVGSSLFWYDSKRGICEAKSIWFDKKSKLQLGRFTVDKSISHQDLKQMFPIDCASTDPITIYQHSATYQKCSVPVKDKKGQLWDMKIIFFLKDDRLVRVEFWEPS